MRHLSSLLCLLLFAGIRAESAGGGLINAKEHVLSNGLKLLVVEDHQVPRVVCRLYFKVGSIFESPGKTGLSHMLEHMMFKGTERVGVADFAKEKPLAKSVDSLFELSDNSFETGDTAKEQKFRAEARALAEKQKTYLKNNELWNLYQTAGGTALNAYTSDLLTAYIVTLPANRLELFMWLESDRMAHPVMREFYTERDVVMEERRLRYETSPYGRYFETLGSIMFEEHPYRIPTIGYMSDLRLLKSGEALAHFKKFYAPNNAVLVIVGDVDEKKALELTEKYFGPVPPSTTLPGPLKIEEPEPVGQRRLVVKKAVGPVLDIFFKTPGLPHPDLFALDVIEGVLNGTSGRLYKILVKDKKLATNVGAGNYVTKYVSYFHINADLIEGASHAEVEKIIFDELNRLKTEPISPRELEKVKNTVSAAEVNGLRSNETLADRLAFYEVCDTWQTVNRFADEVKKVAPARVMETAKEYFTETNSTVGWVAAPEKK